MKNKIEELERSKRELEEELERVRLQYNIVLTKLELYLEDGLLTKKQAEKALVGFPPEFQQLIRETVLSRFE
ncbi:MAG: hypothetical protein ACOYIS_05255 [Candidatus Cloacimonadaceae bacterium]|jgi:hypothetical protein